MWDKIQEAEEQWRGDQEREGEESGRRIVEGESDGFWERDSAAQSDGDGGKWSCRAHRRRRTGGGDASYGFIFRLCIINENEILLE